MATTRDTVTLTSFERRIRVVGLSDRDLVVFPLLEACGYVVTKNNGIG